MTLKEYDKIPLIYFSVGALWIISTDIIVGLVAPTLQDAVLHQTLKGWFYVLVTTLLLRVLVRRHQKRLMAEALARQELYYKTIEGAHHILLNYLNSMQLVMIEAENSKDFDQSILATCREISHQAAVSIEALGDLPEPTSESVLEVAYGNARVGEKAKAGEVLKS